MTLRVLLADDNAEDCAVACLLLRSPIVGFANLSVQTVSTWQQARVEIVMNPPDVLVLNHRMPDGSACQMLAALRGFPHPPVVMLGPANDIDATVQLLRQGPQDCVTKQTIEWDIELRTVIERVVADADRRRTMADVTDNFRDYAAVLANVLARRDAPWAAGAFPPTRIRLRGNKDFRPRPIAFHRTRLPGRSNSFKSTRLGAYRKAGAVSNDRAPRAGGRP